MKTCSVSPANSHREIASTAESSKLPVAGYRVQLIARVALGVVILLLSNAACADGKRDGEGTIRVVTLNLWHDKADWPKRQARIVVALKKLQPDIIALQEVLQDRGLPNQAMTLAKSLGYHYRFSSVDAPSAERRYGNALLTRQPICADDVKALRPLDDYRTVLRVRLQLADREVDLYVTHLHYQPTGGAIRRQQVDDLLAHVQATSADRPTLIAGDFNIDADAPELSPLLARYVDSYDRCHPDTAPDDPAHSTLNLAFHPAQRIDHVFVDSEHFTVLSAQRLFDQPYSDGGWASDHFGVMAILVLRSSNRKSASRSTSSGCFSRELSAATQRRNRPGGIKQDGAEFVSKRKTIP